MNTNNKLRGFEVVVNPIYLGDTTKPTRNDPGSAGYDFYTKHDIKLLPGQSMLVWTDVKAYMQDDEVLYLFVRSSVGGNGLMLKNQVGVIDSTYYENPKNDGNIGFNLFNYESHVIEIKAGDRIGQGVFNKYLAADDDEVLNNERAGGFGSSGK